MLNFDASSFAIAGTLAAAGPVLIHLLNRRRFKTVQWAAMDFLRVALERHRRTLHLRDVLLLAVRMIAVILFGLVLSRPFIKGTTTGAIGQAALLCIALLPTIGLAVAWATSAEGKRRQALFAAMMIGILVSAIPLWGIARHSLNAGAVTQSSNLPVHAILIVDNSRSMGVENLGATLLDRAKSKGHELIELLPPESRVTVIPLAGAESPFTLDAYRNKDDARRALDYVKLVDGEGSVQTGIELAEQACQQSIDPAAKRILLLTDLQQTGWQTGTDLRRLDQFSGLQIVNVASQPAKNIWISGLYLEDGLTSGEIPCRLLAHLHASSKEQSVPAAGDDPAMNVQVKLLINGVEVASQSLVISPGQEKEIEFFPQFDEIADPLKPGSAIATVVVQAEQPADDQLMADNRQQLIIPIVASLPVVFIDQYGSDENVELNRLGETYALRHLLAPRSSSDKAQRRLILSQHIRWDQVTQSLLETARLVVIGGIEAPDEASVPLLKDYVRQGGPLVILAGGDFDPVAWTVRAWQAGNGILPVPLEANPIGVTPEEAIDQIRPFYLAFSSMQHDFFLVEGEDPQVLSSLFEGTPFFKAVRANTSPEILEELRISETRRFRAEQQFLDRYDQRGSARTEMNPATVEDDRFYLSLEPAWWHWRTPWPLVDRSLTPEALAIRSQPRVLAEFDGNGAPFVIERRMGAGRVVFLTSGVTSNWNMLKGSGAMYLFHRICYQLMEETLPQRNFTVGQRITLPVEGHSNLRYSVARPSGFTEPLPVEVLGERVSGVTIRRPVLAGIYRLLSEQVEPANKASVATIEEIPVAVNGADSESHLEAITSQELSQRFGQEGLHLIEGNEPIRLEGGISRGHQTWKTLGWLFLGSLLLEMLILAWPAAKRQNQAAYS